MSWPWRRRESPSASPATLAATRRAQEAQRRAQEAHGQTEAIDRRAAELARELPAGELYVRLARALGRWPHEAG